MRVVAGIAGAVLIVLMLSEFFVTFMLPRRVRRDPRIARGLIRLFWRPWRRFAHRLSTSSEDTFLGLFGPLSLLAQLFVWTIGLILGFALVEYAAAGGNFGHGLLFSSGLFLSAEGASGSTALHVIALFEAAIAIGVLFIVIGYLPAVYGSFSRREVAVSQLSTLVDVCAFVTAVEADGEVEAAEITFAIGRHALADLSLQYRVKYGPANRLADDEFDRLYDAVEHVVSNPVGREEARRRLTELRRVYEPKAQGLASWLALDLPPWVREEDMEELMRLPGVGVSGYGRDLVGQPARRKVRQRDGL